MKYQIETGEIIVLRQLSVKENIERTGKPQTAKALLCMCFCGNEFVAIKGNYPHKVKSCGCLRRGQTQDPLYNMFMHMCRRCLNKKDRSYKWYGGRGITVCDRWLNRENGFWNFKSDMDPRPSIEYSIDRIDVNGPYSPENCRWATQKEQCNNKTNNRVYSYKGEMKNITELAETYNIDRYNLYCRLEDGWSIEKAIETPVKIYKSRTT